MLELTLDGVPRGQRGQVLTATLRSAILEGRLRDGTALPSTRLLATDLGVARGVVVEAYAQLIAEGHLVARHGSGTRVTDHRTTATPPRPIDLPTLAGHNPGQPDPALFPRREWLRALERASAGLSDAAFAYGDARGAVELRDALAGWLARTRSVLTHADQIVVVNGVAQALMCLALPRRGQRAPIVAVEDPGSAGLRDQLRWWGAALVPVPVDRDGLDVEALRRAHATTPIDLVVVTPAHQYPTGVALGPDRRLALVEWAATTGALIVEDDYDADYRYDGQPLTSLHALAPDHVIAVGSASKTLSPALRLGWMALPEALVEPVATIKANIDLGTATLPQVALAQLIASGALDRHLRRTRSEYRRRRDALGEALRQHAPHLRLDGISAGLHATLHLDPGHDEAHVATAARDAGFQAQPLGRYRHRPGPPGVVLGYGPLLPAAIRAGVDELARRRVFAAAVEDADRGPGR